MELPIKIIKNSGSSFYDIYELASDTNSIEKFSRLTANKTCRLCLKTSQEVSFNNEPHFIPQLLGRNPYSSNYECDNCNYMFSRFETDLATFISPFTTLLNMKTKNGVPVFKSRRKDVEKSTTIRNENGMRSVFVQNAADFIIDKEKKEATLTGRRQKANPINIYKSLARIGIMLMPPIDIPNYQEFIDWLINKNDLFSKNPLLMSRNMLVKHYYNIPSAELYKIKEVNFNDYVRPQYILIVRAANLIFQIPYPMFVGLNPEAGLSINLLPDVILHNNSALYKLFDLSENCTSLDEEIKFTFSDLA